jgi:activator of HSP90 ATPase
MVALRVPGTPERAFRVFTDDIGLWWRPNPLFQVMPRGPGVLAFEPADAGTPRRLVERREDGAMFVIGEVSVWRPGERLVFGWRQAGFAADQHTEVEVRFEAAQDQTRVTVEHRGWDSVPANHAARHRFPETVFSLRLAEWWRDLLAAMAEHVP